MTGKIFRSTVFVAVVVLLCCLGVIVGICYDYFDGVQVRQLKDELNLTATATERQGLSYLQGVDPGRFRITWVQADGTVIYDTQADETAMENHADREEIRQALETGSGSARRYSATLTEKTLYEAVKLADGTVLRVSVSSVTTATLVLGMLQPICVIIFVAIILSAVLSHRMAKRIVEPLNKLDLEHPLDNDTYEELSPLLRRINQQHLQINANMGALRQKTDEFEQIIGNMSEGLIVLDKKGLILSINPAAKRIFEADSSAVGRDLFAIDGSAPMRNTVNRAYLEGSAELHICRNGLEYQITVDRICSQGNVIGAVILAFDITQQRLMEQTRREFSANVSHELKTPLQSIMGSAELLENGMVKPEDMSRFVGHIRQEAQRLVNLVEDIIRLSQLDEGVPMPTEQVDMLALAQETVQTLQTAAKAKDVSFHVAGTGFAVTGVRRMLYEIVYNLCDNAMQYNIPGGRIEVSVSDRVLTVSDTGIGIPEEHQQRIFERFYRVDKSHSKASGGTGLGLSIVKHAAAYHNAKLELESAPGKGTTIKVIF